MRTGSGKAKDDTVDLEGIGLNIFKINCTTFKKNNTNVCYLKLKCCSLFIKELEWIFIVNNAFSEIDLISFSRYS